MNNFSYKVVMGFNTLHSEYVWESLPHVSVIIPAYNNGQFIDFTLQSIFRQTYPKEKIEIIVVDDGSTDNTYEIIKEYREKIIYIYQENKGIASARNTGMSMAKGGIITFLDSDDIWYEERLQKVVEKFEEHGVGMVYHPVELIDSDGNTLSSNFNKTFGYKEGISGWVTNAVLSGQIFCGGSSFAFKKAIIEKFYPIPDDIRRGIDYYMSVISSCYETVEYIPEILSKYRVHGDNRTIFAGKQDYRELGIVNKDFAYTRQKTLGKLMDLEILHNKLVDINILKRIQAKEIIFYHVLAGRRSDAIKQLPLLFEGNLRIQDFFKALTISFMALFVPATCYTKIIQAYEFLKRLKIVRF